MYAATFLIALLVQALLLVLVIYNIGNAIKRQAQKPVKRWFAPVPRPGSYSFATNEGRVTDILENVVGWNLKIDETTNGRRLFFPEKHAPDFWEENLGVRWIGIYPTIKVFEDREWSELQEKKVTEDGKEMVRYQIETRKETFTDSFFQFSHPVRTDAIEIQGNYQVVVTMLITVLNLDPERAEFLNKDPSILLAAIVQSTVRSHISDMTFDEVKKMKGTATDGQNQELWEAIKKLNGLEMNEEGKPLYNTEDHLGVFGKLGKYIIRGEIVQVDAVGKAAQALEAEKIAELEGNAEIKKAEKAGEARKTAATKDAEALAIRRQAQADFVMATIVGPIKEGGDSVGHVLEAQVLTGPDSKLNILVQRGASTGTTLPVGKP